MAKSREPPASSDSRSARPVLTETIWTIGATSCTWLASSGRSLASTTSRKLILNTRCAAAGSNCLALSTLPVRVCSDCRTSPIRERVSGEGIIRWPWRVNRGSLNTARSRPKAWLSAGWVSTSLEYEQAALPHLAAHNTDERHGFRTFHQSAGLPGAAQGLHGRACPPGRARIWPPAQAGRSAMEQSSGHGGAEGEGQGRRPVEPVLA